MNPELKREGAIGILGGTFDPVHLGHLRLAEEAREGLGLEKVLFVPAGRPVHRPPPVASSQQRMAMLETVLAEHPCFELDSGEIRSDAPSYTLHTLARVRSQHGPSTPLVLLMGADAFAGLPGWFGWESLLGLAHLGVADRPALSPPWPEALSAFFSAHVLPKGAPLFERPFGHVCTFAMTPLGISATFIRMALAQGRSVRYLMPDSILRDPSFFSYYGTSP
jgi:nicotinate-nucleotide adenylyltransferase